MGYTITTNSYLRALYSDDRSLAKKNEREKLSGAKLVLADTKALKKGVASLSSWDYGDIDQEDTDLENEKFYGKMKAFQDVYNNTTDSTGKSKDESLKGYGNQMKALAEKYKEELSDVGVTFDEKGYMTVRESAIKNIDIAEYEEVFGKSGTFTKDLAKIAAKITKHIDKAV